MTICVDPLIGDLPEHFMRRKFPVIELSIIEFQRTPVHHLEEETHLSVALGKISTRPHLSLHRFLNDLETGKKKSGENVNDSCPGHEIIMAAVASPLRLRFVRCMHAS